VTEPKLNFIETQCAAKGMRMTDNAESSRACSRFRPDHPDVEELYRRCAEIDQHISISNGLSHGEAV